jgi:mannose-1-phosphate guanylyltransferase/mannose-6-phosphate isomerase
MQQQQDKRYMIVPVVMAGGVGSRLWPSSRETLPKQFLAFQDSDGSHNPSLFQQTLQRLEGIDGLGAPVVVCNEEHRFLVAEQLREIGIEAATIILEPVGRNTAPAVALAALAVAEHNPDYLLLVLAADHVISRVDAFRAAVLAGAAAAGNGALVTFGIVPKSPETGYGYIRRGEAAEGGYRVDRFVEKPQLDTARQYLASGEYYWNSGKFMFSARVYLEELQQHAPAMLAACRAAWREATRDLDFHRIPRSSFEACPADSIDYAVMERTSNALVIPLDAGWNDLGAWSAVWEQGPLDENNNVCRGDVLVQDSHNSFIQAESRLVTLVGMDNAVVVETSDAVLVANKARVQEVKDVVKALLAGGRSEAVLHRKVYRPWGSYEGLAEEAGFQVKRIIIKPGAALSLQLHHKRAEHWIVVRGTATVTCGERVFELQENQSTYIPMETKHRLENRTGEPVTLIEVQCGSYLGEDDIVRFDDVYGRKG